MDLLHHPLLLDSVNTPQLRIALNRIRHKLHCFLSRLTTRPAPQLVLIGLPGTGKITLSNQIVLIEAAEPKLQATHVFQSALNSIAKSLRFTIQNLKLSAELNQNQKSFSETGSSSGLKEIETSMDAPKEPYLHAITTSADVWNFVTAEEGFAEI